MKCSEITTDLKMFENIRKIGEFWIFIFKVVKPLFPNYNI